MASPEQNIPKLKVKIMNKCVLHINIYYNSSTKWTSLAHNKRANSKEWQPLYWKNLGWQRTMWRDEIRIPTRRIFSRNEDTNIRREEWKRLVTVLLVFPIETRFVLVCVRSITSWLHTLLNGCFSLHILLSRVFFLTSFLWYGFVLNEWCVWEHFTSCYIT